MNCTGKLEENVNLKRRDLAHRLSRLKQIIFGDRFHSVIASCVQINSFDEFHVVQKRTERHEIWETNFVSFGHLQEILFRLKKTSVGTSTDLNQIIFDLRSQQMLFNAKHDILKVQSGDKSSSVRIFCLESFQRTFFMKVMKELRKL